MSGTLARRKRTHLPRCHGRMSRRRSHLDCFGISGPKGSPKYEEVDVDVVFSFGRLREKLWTESKSMKTTQRISQIIYMRVDMTMAMKIPEMGANVVADG